MIRIEIIIIIIMIMITIITMIIFTPSGRRSIVTGKTQLRSWS